MKFSIRTFVLAAIAAASFAAASQSVSAQYLFANATTSDHVLPWNGVGTINAVILPYAGTYLIGGQQALLVEGNQQTSVQCWAAPKPNSTSMLTHGPWSASTVTTGGYVTLPLNGYYSVTEPTEIWVSCEYSAPSTATEVATLAGTITATLMQ